jgi:hypothetical protein
MDYAGVLPGREVRPFSEAAKLSCSPLLGTFADLSKSATRLTYRWTRGRKEADKTIPF